MALNLFLFLSFGFVIILFHPAQGRREKGGGGQGGHIPPRNSHAEK